MSAADSGGGHVPALSVTDCAVRENKNLKQRKKRFEIFGFEMVCRLPPSLGAVKYQCDYPHDFLTWFACITTKRLR